VSIPAVTRERDFQRLVIDAASALGYRHYAALYSIGSDPGYPDVTLVNPRTKRTIWLELKITRGKVSERQRQWIADLRAAGCAAYVVTPDDWDQIESLLRGDVDALDPATLRKDVA